MKTETAVSGYAPPFPSRPSLPETVFRRELALWRQVTGGEDAVQVLAAAHGAKLYLTTLPQSVAQHHWRDAPQWLHRLASDPSVASLSAMDCPPSPQDFDRFESLRPVAAPVEALLLADGDKRSTLSPITGLNRYGCAPSPQTGTIAFSACSGNEPGPLGLAAATDLRLRLMKSAWNGTLAQDVKAVSSDQSHSIAAVMGISLTSEHKVSLVESGTAAVRLVAEHLTKGDQPCLYLVIGPKETGNDIPDAVKTAFHVTVGHVDIREGLAADPVSQDAMEHLLEQRIAQAQALGMRVVLQSVEGSKTGMVVPGFACVKRLADRFPKDLAIVGDFCQMRPGTAVAPYLALGACIVATGSKFLGGPAFSGIAIIPGGEKQPPATVGTTLRWEAALAESQGYASLSQRQVDEGLTVFADTLRRECARFTSLVPIVDRAPAHVMAVQILDRDGRFMDMDRLRALHVALMSKRCLIGQPVAVGDSAALRLAINAKRLTSVVEDPDGRERLVKDLAVVLTQIDALR